MKSYIMAGAAAIALTLGSGVVHAAVAGSGTNPDYAQNQPGLRATSSYRIETGEAHVGDGSDPSYYTPRYSGGTGAARVGDGSDPGFLDTQRALRNMPGCCGGGGGGG
ncbi:MAG TPA: hypothetical protein VMB73_06005 [Acetobacteraceae bacterium]|jgi:hypothetical protein|nr:hypothetical protein [Acetobacteraceae bacterium]